MSVLFSILIVLQIRNIVKREFLIKEIREAGGTREEIEEQMNDVFDEYLPNTWFGQRVMSITCYTGQRTQR